MRFKLILITEKKLKGFHILNIKWEAGRTQAPRTVSGWLELVAVLDLYDWSSGLRPDDGCPLVLILLVILLEQFGHTFEHHAFNCNTWVCGLEMVTSVTSLKLAVFCLCVTSAMTFWSTVRAAGPRLLVSLLTRCTISPHHSSVAMVTELGSFSQSLL